jgi:cell division protein FtsW
MRSAAAILFFSAAALTALGVVMLVSASVGAKVGNYLVMQPIWCAIGLTACWGAAASDYRALKQRPWLIWTLFGAVLVLLVLVLIPHIGVRIKGASRWLKFGPMTMQPSELAKLALVTLLAHYADRYQRWMPTFWRGMVIPGVIVAVVLALIFKEPDVGTVMLLATVSGVMLLIAGIRWRFFLPPVLVGIVALGVFLWNNPMRSERIYSWLHIEETKLDKGLQTFQAMVALGSGGVTGVGLGDGRQKLGFIPEHHTDFIFSVIGEELGLIATIGVIVGFVALVACGLYIAWHATDAFGMLLASGITFLIGFQAVINIGVVTGSLPNKGISLPFLSYGGSNLVVMLASIGVLISVARNSHEPKKNPFSVPETLLEPQPAH